MRYALRNLGVGASKRQSVRSSVAAKGLEVCRSDSPLLLFFHVGRTGPNRGGHLAPYSNNTQKLVRGSRLIRSFRSAVAAVPEGLPMVATSTLVFAVDKMRRRNMIVRRLDAIEAIASV